MRRPCSLAFFLLTAATFAQAPVIGPDQFFEVGRYYLRDNYDPPLPLVGTIIATDGPDYALDLTSLVDGILYGTDSVVCTAAPTLYAYHTDYYDTANVMITVNDVSTGEFSQYVFLDEPDRVRYVGGQPNGAGGTGNDLVLQRYLDNGFAIVLEAGMTYGYSSTETVDAEWVDLSGSDGHTVTGTVTNLIDGYGSITLPDGEVLPHTLRLRSVMSYTDENDLFGTIEHQDTLYTWYAEGYSGPVMTMGRGFYALTAGYVSPLPFTLYRPQAISTGVPAPAQASALTLVPNPTADRVHILGAPSRAVYRLLDPQGRQVAQGRLDGQGGVNVGALPAGSYLLELPGTTHAPLRVLVAR